ncbi:MAG: hypothetical protein WCE80_14475 [Acidimicrobiia bacterium]
MLAVAVVVIASTACQPEAQPQSSETAGTVPEVSKQDYDSAFEEFRTCVADGGGQLNEVSVDPRFGTYLYHYTEADRPLVDACYFAHFQEAQIGYESHNEAMQKADAEENKRDWEQNVLPCLRDQGFDDVPADFDEVVQLPGDEAMDLYRTAEQLIATGSCNATYGDQ